mgnify:CR=1 FL=1
MERAFLAAVFGKADGDQFPIGRRHEPIHRDLTLRFDLVRIEHDLLHLVVVDQTQFVTQLHVARAVILRHLLSHVERERLRADGYESTRIDDFYSQFA